MPARPPKVLVVEDDEQLSLLLTRLLEQMGLQVQGVASGVAAIQNAAGARPDLIILDVNLPDQSGLHVCQVVRSLYGHATVPILMLTGMNQPIDQLRGYAHGADAYLTKPCKMTDLTAAISALLEPNYPDRTVPAPVD